MIQLWGWLSQWLKRQWQRTQLALKRLRTIIKVWFTKVWASFARNKWSNLIVAFIVLIVLVSARVATSTFHLLVRFGLWVRAEALASNQAPISGMAKTLLVILPLASLALAYVMYRRNHPVAPRFRYSSSRKSGDFYAAVLMPFGLAIGVGILWGVVYFLAWGPGILQFFSFPTSGRVDGESNATRRSVMDTNEVHRRTAEFWYAHLPAAEAKEMVEIATEESHFHQFNADGSAFTGVEDPADTGVMQINVRENRQDLADWGLDVHTLEGNLEAARRLREKYGVRPWRRTVDKIKNRPPQVVAIKVPKEGRSERFTPAGRFCQGGTDLPVTVWDDRGRSHSMTPTSVPVVTSLWYEYSTPSGGVPATITVSCR